MIQLLDNIYAVPVDANAISFDIIDKESLPVALMIFCEGVYSYPIKLPSGKYDILGTCTAADIDFDVEPYTNATGLMGQYTFRQLLRDKGILFENPLGDRRPQNFPDGADYNTPIELYNAQIKWDKAQQNVVENIVIIKKL